MLCEILAATRAENGAAFVAVGGATTRLPDSAFIRLVAYLDFLLRGRAAAVVGHRPNVSELTELSVTLYPEFVKIIKPEYARLADVLHAAFREEDPSEISLPPDHFVMQACVALGVLLRITGERVEDAHDRVREWYDTT